jgi:hypothetical protein
MPRARVAKDPVHDGLLGPLRRGHAVGVGADVVFAPHLAGLIGHGAVAGGNAHRASSRCGGRAIGRGSRRRSSAGHAGPRRGRAWRWSRTGGRGRGTRWCCGSGACWCWDGGGRHGAGHRQGCRRCGSGHGYCSRRSSGPGGRTGSGSCAGRCSGRCRSWRGGRPGRSHTRRRGREVRRTPGAAIGARALCLSPGGHRHGGQEYCRQELSMGHV